MDTVSVAWAFCLVLWIWLQASLLANVTTFTRVAVLFDRPGPAWLQTGFGFACVVVVSSNLRDKRADSTHVLAKLVLSALAFAGYTYHLFLLRWPWLTGVAAADWRLTVWGATLSTTWNGVPLLAFGELMSIGLLLTHAFVGLSASAAWRVFANTSGRVRVTTVAVGVISYLLASAVVIALATGRR